MEEELLISVFVSPFVGAAAAYLFRQIGLARRSRELDYAEKRIGLLSDLLGSENIDEDSKQHIKAHLDAAVEVLLNQDPIEGVDPGTGTTTSQSQMLIKWEDYPLWRRALAPPFRRSIGGWTAIVLFYYFAVAMVSFVYWAVVSVDPISSPDPTLPDVSTGNYNTIIVAAIFVGLCWVWVRWGYRNGYMASLQSNRTRRHNQVSATTHPEGKQAE